MRDKNPRVKQLLYNFSSCSCLWLKEQCQAAVQTYFFVIHLCLVSKIYKHDYDFLMSEMCDFSCVAKTCMSDAVDSIIVGHCPAVCLVKHGWREDVERGRGYVF